MAVEEGDKAKCILVPVGDQAKCQACSVKNQVMKRCTRCKAVFYCSRECQVKHWHTHKFLCGPNPQQTIQDHDDSSSDTPVAAIASAQSEPAPLRSGCRIRPDGGYESYADGVLCDDRGFPIAKPKPKDDANKNKQIRPCITCGGQGRTATTCEGIVRSDYCTACEGQGVLLV